MASRAGHRAMLSATRRPNRRGRAEKANYKRSTTKDIRKNDGTRCISIDSKDLVHQEGETSGKGSGKGKRRKGRRNSIGGRVLYALKANAGTYPFGFEEEDPEETESPRESRGPEGWERWRCSCADWPGACDILLGTICVIGKENIEEQHVSCRGLLFGQKGEGKIEKRQSHESLHLLPLSSFLSNSKKLSGRQCA